MQVQEELEREHIMYNVWAFMMGRPEGFWAKSHDFNSGFQEALWPAVQVTGCTGDKRETSWN